MYLLAFESNPRMTSVTRLQRLIARALGNKAIAASTIAASELEPVLRQSEAIVGFDHTLANARSRLGLRSPLLLLSYGMSTRAFLPIYEWKSSLMAGDSILFASKHDQRCAASHLLENAALRCVHLPYPVDDCFLSTMPRAEARRKLRSMGCEFADGAPIVLYVGRICAQKNLHQLLRLFAAVRSVIRDARLLIVGDYDDSAFPEMDWKSGGYKQLISETIERLHLEGAMDWIEYMPPEEMVAAYCAADVNLTCSVYRTEDYGFTSVEAAACGCPTIGTAWGGLNDTIVDAVTGYRMPTYFLGNSAVVDWRAGAELVIWLLQNDAARTNLGQKAMEYVKSTLTEAQFSVRLVEALQGIVARAPVTSQRLSLDATFDAPTLSFFDSLDEEIARGHSLLEARYRQYLDSKSHRIEEFIAPYAGSSRTEIGASTQVYTPFEVNVLQDAVEIFDPSWHSIKPITRLAADVLRIAPEPMQIADIAAATAASFQSVCKACEGLINDGLLVPLLPALNIVETTAGS